MNESINDAPLGGGVPAITYLRILPSNNNKSSSEPRNRNNNDQNSSNILVDGNTITYTGDNTRYDVATVLDRNLNDEDVCEHVFGIKAGGENGLLNPIRAFVMDAATITIFIVGSKQTKKWKYLKKILLPFIANELFTNINNLKSILNENSESNSIQIELSLNSFEIQDEIISDLLQTNNRGLTLNMTVIEGMKINGLIKIPIKDETSLRKMFRDTCENR